LAKETIVQLAVYVAVIGKHTRLHLTLHDIRGRLQAFFEVRHSSKDCGILFDGGHIYAKTLFAGIIEHT